MTDAQFNELKKMLQELAAIGRANGKYILLLQSSTDKPYDMLKAHYDQEIEDLRKSLPPLGQ